MKIQKMAALLILSGVLLSISALGQEISSNPDAPSALHVVSYDLVSKTRVGQSEYVYEYAVIAENTSGKNLQEIIAKVTSYTGNASVTDDNVFFNIIEASKTARFQDTISVLTDNVYSFDPNSLTFSFDTKGIEGIDVNNNHIRDDVEFFISETEFAYSSSRRFNMALDIAKYDQINITKNLTDDEIKENFISGAIALSCLRLDLEKETKSTQLALSDINRFTTRLELLQINTPDRIAAYKNYENRLASISPLGLSEYDETEQFCLTRYPY